MALSESPFLQVRGSRLIDGAGTPVRLKGFGLGGWLNMENFITGYPANESMMRAAVTDVLGADRAELFFDRLLTVFFTEADAALLVEAGLNLLRLPVNYRHLEDDARPFEIVEDGFRHLDRVIDLCAARGIYTIIDLHALPGSQNHHWHSDNPTHIPLLWQHPHFQDRSVHLWEVIADRYKDNPWVAGYNPMNEPADQTRQLVGPFSRRLVEAIRAVDPMHAIFLDGNTYSTEFDVFDEPWDNTVYTCHDYAGPGLGDGGRYPGTSRGTWVDRDAVEAKFLQRTEFSRRTNTPIWVGEFGPIYTGDPAIDEERRQLLADQLEIYRRYDASWALWTYKDIGPQGIATVSPESPYGRLIADHVAKKKRLGVDKWATTGREMADVTGPVTDLITREFPGFDPYPWGPADWTRLLLMNITMAQPMVGEYAALFRGLDDGELLALADSFALATCDIRGWLVQTLSAG
jgi:endoglucanase